GKVHLSLCNLDPTNSRELQCRFQGLDAGRFSGRVLTAEFMSAHNTFDRPEAVKPAEFDDFSLKETS
ncbi:MAG: alpha-L-arabinofuranosidase C-terminal domain-containing protein, partial [Planctomycetota bacterium]